MNMCLLCAPGQALFTYPYFVNRPWDKCSISEDGRVAEFICKRSFSIAGEESFVQGWRNRWCKGRGPICARVGNDLCRAGWIMCERVGGVMCEREGGAGDGDAAGGSGRQRHSRAMVSRQGPGPSHRPPPAGRHSFSTLPQPSLLPLHSPLPTIFFLSAALSGLGRGSIFARACVHVCLLGGGGRGSMGVFECM